jgi:hypothetical protein
MKQASNIRKIGSMFLSMIFLLTIPLINSNANENEPRSAISEISSLKNYTEAYIQGEVIRLLDDDEVLLKDNTATIRVYTGWKNPNALSLGEKVIIKGALDPGIIKEFYASKIIRSNGDVVHLNTND